MAKMAKTDSTSEKAKLILLSFPQILSQLAFTSTMVINLGECSIVRGFMPWVGKKLALWENGNVLFEHAVRSNDVLYSRPTTSQEIGL